MGIIFRTEAQKADFGALELGRQKPASGKYLDFRMRWSRLLGFSAILQAAERIRLWFMAQRFRIPSPPSCFGAQIFFQTVRQRALDDGSDETPVHQKVRMTSLILAMNFLEKIMLDM
jgi:hypothetical protein